MDALLGLHKSMTSNDYHSIRGYMSSSGYKQMIVSPAHYQAYLRKEDKQTEAQVLGEAYHACVLQPDLFKYKYVIINGDRRTKEVKAKVELAEQEGKTSIKQEVFESILRMSSNTLNKLERLQLLQPTGVKECSIFVIDNLTGCPIKIRPDYIDPERGIILDLKSYSSAYEPDFRHQFWRQRYDIQAALYKRVASQYFERPFEIFCNVVCETEDPYEVNVIQVGEATLDRALENMDDTLFNFKRCLELNEWPGLPDEIIYSNIDIL
jgi:hypothetical protein